MSIRRMQELYAKQRCWTPAQWGVLNALAWYERESVGHAWPSVELLMDRTGYSRSHLLEILAQLRRNRLAEPLGRDYNMKGRPQRWRVTLDPHEARPVPLPLSAAVAPVENSESLVRPAGPSTASPGDLLVRPAGLDWSDFPGVMGRPAGPMTGDPLCTDQVSTSNLKIELSTATAESAPRLPTLLGVTPKKPKASVAPKTPYQHVVDVVQKLLLNPIRASRLIGLDPPITKWSRVDHDAQKGDLSEAVKVYCARGHINGWEHEWFNAVECEWFKYFNHDVIRGLAPRPRDLQRRRRR